LRVLVVGLALTLAAPAAASAQSASTGGGGAAFVPPPPPAKRAKIVDGIAIPPKKAPRRVKRTIAWANQIVRKPYVYGGGHKPFKLLRRKLDRGYDCSGAVSHALWGGRFLRRLPLNSSGFMRWGEPGEGRWVTVYTNPGHAYVVIAGLRFDTSLGDRSTRREVSSGDGPRWREYRRSPRGFAARHPQGF
jgi:hypothetical protein